MGVQNSEKNPGLAWVATWLIHCTPVGLCYTEYEYAHKIKRLSSDHFTDTVHNTMSISTVHVLWVYKHWQLLHLMRTKGNVLNTRIYVGVVIIEA